MDKWWVSEHLRVEDVIKADQLRSTIINALKDHCTNSPMAPKTTHYFAKLFGRLTEIQSAATLGRQALAACHSWGIQIPPALQHVLAADNRFWFPSSSSFPPFDSIQERHLSSYLTFLCILYYSISNEKASVTMPNSPLHALFIIDFYFDDCKWIRLFHSYYCPVQYLFCA